MKRLLFALPLLPGVALSSARANQSASVTPQIVDAPLFKLACLAIAFSFLATVLAMTVLKHDPELQKRSGSLLLKQYGVALILPAMLAAVFSVLIVLGVNRFSVQLTAGIVDTCMVFLHVFCNVGSLGGGTLIGFSLEEPEVQQKLLCYWVSTEPL